MDQGGAGQLTAKVHLSDSYIVYIYIPDVYTKAISTLDHHPPNILSCPIKKGIKYTCSNVIFSGDHFQAKLNKSNTAIKVGVDICTSAVFLVSLRRVGVMFCCERSRIFPQRPARPDKYCIYLVSGSRPF